MQVKMILRAPEKCSVSTLQSGEVVVNLSLETIKRAYCEYVHKEALALRAHRQQMQAAS